MGHTPKRSHADVTRNTILKVSKKLFSQLGFEGTSISTIATKAKINQSLIYHHFKNKASLWKEVKAYMLATHFNPGELNYEALFAETDARQFLENFFMVRLALYEKSPELRRMVYWQSLENDATSLWGCNLYMQSLREKISMFQAQGLMRSDIDVETIMTVLLQMPLNFFGNYYRQCKKDTKQYAHYKNNFCRLQLDFLKQLLVA